MVNIFLRRLERLNKDPSFQKSRYKALNKKPNKQERMLQEMLDSNFPNHWKFVGDGTVILANLSPDFININEQKKIIELFGDYYHSAEKCRRWHQTELGRIVTYSQFGYETLIVWEYELKDKEALLQKIEKFSQSEDKK